MVDNTEDIWVDRGEFEVREDGIVLRYTQEVCFDSVEAFLMWLGESMAEPDRYDGGAKGMISAGERPVRTTEYWEQRRAKLPNSPETGDENPHFSPKNP